MGAFEMIKLKQIVDIHLEDDCKYYLRLIYGETQAYRFMTDFKSNITLYGYSCFLAITVQNEIENAL